MPVTLKKGCSRAAFKKGLCNNFQAIQFNDGKTRRKLFFNSVKDREDYYKKHLKGYKKFMRYSVMSTQSKTRSKK
jgi:hypothetical protein